MPLARLSFLSRFSALKEMETTATQASSTVQRYQRLNVVTAAVTAISSDGDSASQKGRISLKESRKKRLRAYVLLFFRATKVNYAN